MTTDSFILPITNYHHYHVIYKGDNNKVDTALGPEHLGHINKQILFQSLEFSIFNFLKLINFLT